MAVPPAPPAGNGELPHSLEQYMRDAGELPGSPPVQHETEPLLAIEMQPPAAPQFEANPIVAALSDPPAPVQPPTAPHQLPRVAQAAPRAAPPPRKQPPVPDFAGLPPAMAESLAKLAGVPWPPQPNGAHETRELEDHAVGGAGPKKG
jgi:hypothetical protein